jgi:predicted amidophosphoribosyltransferase
VASVAAAWDHEGPARALILALKLRGLRSANGPLVEGMTEAARRGGLLGTVVTWVPGGSPGIKARGFDHAELLGRGLAHRLGLRALPLLERRRASPDQASLSARARAENAWTAFSARPSPSEVVLVDDLITTGATAAACASALKAAGSRRVEMVVATRA